MIDNNDKIGGQFNMQTHQFFFSRKKSVLAVCADLILAKTLAGENMEGIYLNSTVWGYFGGETSGCEKLGNGCRVFRGCRLSGCGHGGRTVYAGFENDDLPGVYTAAVVQKMMNNELTLLGEECTDCGSRKYRLLDFLPVDASGAHVKAIIEGMPKEGGFPVQANRVRRLAIPIMTSHVLLKAIPNANHTGNHGAVIAECENFKPIPVRKEY